MSIFESTWVWCVVLFMIVFGGRAEAVEHQFQIGKTDFLLDGKPHEIRCGEMHAARIPAEYWRHRLRLCKAMGLNTVCAYMFWNLTEPVEGKFNWSGQADMAQFCRIAQEEGLWVILRPGPYACAEWEMGGLPWWLLKDADIKLRTRDPRYVQACRNYLREVGRELGPLQVTHGGPILMVQVENEYGFYGDDAEYMGEMRQATRDAGFDVPLFCCNPVQGLKKGYRSDLFEVANFGSNPVGAFKTLREIQPDGPLMCGEFYMAWFDKWGTAHHVSDSSKFMGDLENMLKQHESFSLYMAHGGTTFGLWAGADRPYKPDTSSYDYDAPISEAGWVTPKYLKLRELFSKYLQEGETLPEPPEANPVMAFPAVTATECAPVFENLPAPISDKTPRPMEQYDQGYGMTLYRTSVPAGAAETLQADAVHDFGFIYLDGKLIDVMDRRSALYHVQLPAREKAATLDILVEAMGRVNFGVEVHDRKGLFAPVKLDKTELTDWKVYPLPLDEKMMGALKFGSASNGPAFWRANVDLPQAADTFLDMHGWGKGVAWVNGHCLGRYWNIGPTQTMYVPGPWLKQGSNEFVVLDLLANSKPMIAGLDKPILGELHPELDFAAAHQRHTELTIANAQPAYVGKFAPGDQAQEIHFANAVSGRYFCFQSVDAFDNKPYAAIAELDLLDESLKPISHESWTIAYVDSEEHAAQDGSAQNAIDGQTATFWHTEWSDESPSHPHELVIDLGASRAIKGFRYVPRPGPSSVGGRVKDFKIYVGDDLVRAKR